MSAMISEWIGSDRVGCVIDGQFPLQRWLGGVEETGVFLTRMGDGQAQNAAIKIIPAAIADGEAVLNQWVGSKRLIHHSLIKLFHAGRCRMDDCDLLYSVTDLADEILAEVLLVRPLTPLEVREMLDPLLDALSWLHNQGLVHGGLKPSNVMVVNERIVLSVDRVQAAGPRIFPVLSPDIHDAPESAAKITAAADIWSLGVLLVEVLTQRPPRWDGSGPRIPASVPQPFSAIASECLRLDPCRRCTIGDIKMHLAPPGRGTPALVRPPKLFVVPPAAVAAAPARALEGSPLLTPPAPEQAPPPPAAEAPPHAIGRAEPPAEGAPEPLGAEPLPQPAGAPPNEAKTRRGSPHPRIPARIPAAAPAKVAPEPGANHRATLVSAAMALAAAGLALTLAQHHSRPRSRAARSSAASAAPAPAAKPITPAASMPAHPASPPATPAPARTVPASLNGGSGAAPGPATPGAVLHQVLPDVTQRALSTIRGRLVVIVRAQVDANGNVSQATFDYEGNSHYLKTAALAAAQNWKFRAARIGGRPVPSVWDLQFWFEPAGPSVVSTERAP